MMTKITHTHEQANKQKTSALTKLPLSGECQQLLSSGDLLLKIFLSSPNKDQCQQLLSAVYLLLSLPNNNCQKCSVCVCVCVFAIICHQLVSTLSRFFLVVSSSPAVICLFFYFSKCLFIK